MRHFSRLLPTLAAVLLSTAVAAQSVPPVRLTLTSFATGLSRTVDIANAPGDNRLFAVDRAGRIRIVTTAGAVLPTPFLDISSRVLSSGTEQGLIGLAFHPAYATNGFFYVNYIDLSGNTRIVRFQRTAGTADQADPASELLIFSAVQPFSNHNGGCLRFGPTDGYLYAGLGDGGSANDPGNRAQNLSSPLGKILRFDVDGGTPYAVPPTNPLVNTPGALPEIWLWGLRNPWRFSFDSQTHAMWIADVGQNQWEEVDVFVDSAGANRNFGWRCYEGNHVAVGGGCQPIASYHAPVFEYPHSNATGGFSITGGFVYRGRQSPALQGRYVCADYVSGNFWTTATSTGAYLTTRDSLLSRTGISTFGEDNDRELYCASFTTIWRVSGTSVTGLPTDLKLTAGLQVSPNPAALTCHIALPVAEPAEVRLVHLLTGQTVRLTYADAATASAVLNVSGLAAGCYAIQVRGKNHQWAERLIVQPQ